MVSDKSKDLMALAHWIKPNVSTMLPNWLHKILPASIAERDLVCKCAALVGTTMADKIVAGQVSHVHDSTIVGFAIRTPRAANALANFGRECCMSSRASILRTAIMIGLQLPRVELGVISCTRVNIITQDEITALRSAAEQWFPEEFSYGRAIRKWA